MPARSRTRSGSSARSAGPEAAPTSTATRSRASSSATTSPIGISRRALAELTVGLEGAGHVLASDGAMARGGRLVTVGVKAGAEATLDMRVLGLGLTVKGLDGGRSEPRVWTQAVAKLAGYLAAGKLRLAVEALPLAEVATAWARQADAPRRRLVLVP